MPAEGRKILTSWSTFFSISSCGDGWSQPSERSSLPAKHGRSSTVTALNQLDKPLWGTPNGPTNRHAIAVSEVRTRSGIYDQPTPWPPGITTASAFQRPSIRFAAAVRAVCCGGGSTRSSSCPNPPPPPHAHTRTPLGGFSRPTRPPAPFKAHPPLCCVSNRSPRSPASAAARTTRPHFRIRGPAPHCKNRPRAHRLTENSSATADVLLDETENQKITRPPRAPSAQRRQRASAVHAKEAPRSTESAAPAEAARHTSRQCNLHCIDLALSSSESSPP